MACGMAEWVTFLQSAVMATVVVCRVRNPAGTAPSALGKELCIWRYINEQHHTLTLSFSKIKPQEWPVEALHSVATKFLSKLEMSDDMLRKCVDLCQDFQVTSKVVTNKYMLELGRIVYITPMSYLELIGMFQLIFVSKTTFVLLHT